MEKIMQEPVNCTNQELCTYLQALVEEYLPISCLDTNVSAQLKLNPIASKSYQHGKKTVVFHGFPSLMMSLNLMESPGLDSLTLSQVGFHAKTFQSLEKAKDSAAKEAACGLSNLGSFVKWDQDMHTWKTAQLSLLGGLESYSETWPKSGLMQNGVCYQAERWEPCISESESGYSLPTIVKSEGKGSARKRYVNSALFRGAKMSEGLRTCEEDPIYLNPCFAEVVMGWPMGWTDLQPLETVKFREWQQLHTIYLGDES